MFEKLPSAFRLSPKVAEALRSQRPVVALESTVISHGLPYPENRTIALDMEFEVDLHDAVPATIGVIDGRILIGLDHEQIDRLSKGQDLHKISSRDFAPAVTNNWTGGTTVAGTLVAAQAAGIRVFATGGIGGVHRASGGSSHDVSADLHQLAKTPLVVVCSGAKAILDLPATLEYLETFSVPVVGYRTDDFPAFYSRRSGLQVTVTAGGPAEVAAIAREHWGLGLKSAILLVNPPPEEVALPTSRVAEAVRQALRDAKEERVRGQEVTPFLLTRVSEITGGDSLNANLGLLRSNAALAAQVAIELAPKRML